MSEEKIVISRFDLRDPKIDEVIMTEQAARRPMTAVERAPVETSLLYNPIFYTSVAGTFGAFLAWLVCEPFITDGGKTGFGVFMLFPLTAASIGLMIGFVEGFMSRNFVKAAKCGLVGLGVGLAWGIVGLFAAGMSFGLLLGIGASFFPPTMDGEKTQLNAGLILSLMIARSFAWTIVGTGMGVGQGIALASKKLILNGVVGGLLGGFMGGLFFDPVSLIGEKLMGEMSGAPSRAIGIAVIGLSVGVFLGLIESISKEAWFTMKTGPLRGKQFIVYNNPMVIGSSPKCDIYIFKDPAIEPRHAEVHQIGSKFELRDCTSPQGVFINGGRIQKKVLEKGDVIVIGESVLEFDQKIR